MGWRWLDEKLNGKLSNLKTGVSFDHWNNLSFGYA